MKNSERLARAICQEYGHDPETLVTQAALMPGPFNSIVVDPKYYQYMIVPVWTLYLQTAMATLRALNALDLSEE